ncbi:MAG TPA: peptidyl-prolyl cis-trans isomerase [Rhodospirillaceae bacterium]|nr:peptidyl-prolyl cis-trans isomerase [Rhodospirillaceae bacterium]
MISLRSLAILFTGCLALLSSFALTSEARAADEAQRVAAVVNEDIISLRDLEQRMHMVLLSSNLPDTLETRSRLLPQVMRRLIDERLQIQEAERLKINVTATDIAGGIATIERQNRMPAGQFEPFLQSRGVNPETMRQQVRAELGWAQVIRRELSGEVHVGEESIDTRLQALRANFGKPEYLAAEIFLSVDDSRHEDEVRNLAERLIEQMRLGAPFSALAMQFSQTGASGGNLGWVSEGMLDQDLFRALAKLEPSTITPPIRTNDGYHILLLLDRRTAGQGLSVGPTLDVLSLEVVSLPSATLPEREAQLTRLRETLAAGKNCDDFERLVKDVPSASANRNNKVPLKQLPANIEPLISNLPIGSLSQPLDLGNSRRLFAVCQREDDSGGLPSRDAIRQRIEDEQLDVLARRYLRDLRRSAFVEIRI